MSVKIAQGCWQTVSVSSSFTVCGPAPGFFSGLHHHQSLSLYFFYNLRRVFVHCWVLWGSLFISLWCVEMQWQCTTGWLLQVKGATSSNRMSVGFIGAGQLAHALVKGFTAAGKATFSNLCLEVSDVKITHKWCLVGCGEQCSRSYACTVSTFRSSIRPEQLHS